MSPSPDRLEPQPQSYGYLTNPVRNAVTSAFRRVYSDPFGTKPGSSHSSQNRGEPYDDEFQDFQEGSLIDLGDSDAGSPKRPSMLQPESRVKGASDDHAKGLVSSVLEPSPRSTPPPFQPPPLTPLALNAASGGSQILSKLLAEEIRLLLPPRLQLVDAWQLAFSLERDGASLATLYDKCAEFNGKRGGFVLVVKDGLRNTFGAYLSDPPHPSKGHYYGNGECFLWRCSILQSISMPSLASLPPPPSTDTTHATRMTTLGSSQDPLRRDSGGNAPQLGSGHDDPIMPERIRFKAFPYSGINDYMIFCEHGFLSVGGGDGHYGLWLDSSLENGVSSSCPTFGNEPLSEEGTKFDVLDVEIWYLGV